MCGTKGLLVWNLGAYGVELRDGGNEGVWN